MRRRRNSLSLNDGLNALWRVLLVAVICAAVMWDSEAHAQPDPNVDTHMAFWITEHGWTPAKYAGFCAVTNALGATRIEQPYLQQAIAAKSADWGVLAYELGVTEEGMHAALTALTAALNDGSVTWTFVIDYAQGCQDVTE